MTINDLFYSDRIKHFDTPYESNFINGFTFMVNKESQSLIIFLNGEYDNKVAVSSVSKTSWKKTHNSLKEELELKAVSNDHINFGSVKYALLDKTFVRRRPRC